jgi:hypothetical protein
MSFKADLLGGFEIGHQLEFGRKFHQQISRFGAVQDSIDVRGRLSNHIEEIVP